MTAPIPETGQLVDVRQRRYVVADVQASTLPPDPLAVARPRHHLVTLSAMDDDALGEELQVIWELEVGATIHDTLALPLPSGLDTPDRQDAFLNAVRWGASASATHRLLHAPFRSGIDIEDYQLDPVIRALQMVRVNLLIADDVGLGKTIEAGLVLQELLLRHRARRMLVVCPAALQRQWRDQMRDKFGLEFRIVDSALMKHLRRARGIHVNPWTHFPRLITSIDFLKRDHPMRLFRETLPTETASLYPRRYDVLVVDEAHNVAPSGTGRYALDSQRTRAIRLLAPHFEHKLFLTATPHNGYVESFSALLELLDDQRFARGIAPDPGHLATVMVRRLKSELTHRWSGLPRFPKRELNAIEVLYTDEERQAHAWLNQYGRLRRQGQTDAVERTATEFVLMVLKKRLLSSPAAFLATLRTHEQTITQTQRATSRTTMRRPAVGVLRAMVDQLDDGTDDDETDEDTTESLMQTTSSLFRPLSSDERTLLHRMLTWADQAAKRPDSKAQQLLDWLSEHMRPQGDWSDERVIVFTEYRATQKWLQGLFAAAGLTRDGRVLMLYGGMLDEEREHIKAAFQAHPHDSAVRLLLATDAASEGIDLQRHCHRLIHYEIPWNPNRMEQRNGRIDRHGQQHNPMIFHFAPAALTQGSQATVAAESSLESDLAFLMRAVQKVEHIREDLGKVGPVIAEQVVEALVGGTRRQLETQAAERAAAPVRQMITFERNLREQIARHYEQLEESRQVLHLTPQAIQQVVQVALELADQPPLEPTTLEGLWPDPTGERTVCPVFRVPYLRGSWARCTEGLEHPYTGAPRPIVFDHHLAAGRDDVVLVHLNHRVVQMSLRLLRAEVWRSDMRRGLHRVSMRVIPDHISTLPLVVAHARLVITGGDSHRLHEEVLTAGGEIERGRFRRSPVTRIDAAFAAATQREPSAPVRQDMLGFWDALMPGVQKALEARQKVRAESIQAQLMDRMNHEITTITTVLRELEQTIRTEIGGPEYEQLALFSTAEREQYHRNIAALEARLAQIPGEIEHETAAIRARFASPQARLFPIAVTFLVPERLS